MVWARRGVVPRHGRGRPVPGLDQFHPRIPAEPRARSGLHAGLRSRAGDAEQRLRHQPLLRARLPRLLRAPRRLGRARAGGQRYRGGGAPPGAGRGNRHRPAVGGHAARDPAGPRRDGRRVRGLG